MRLIKGLRRRSLIAIATVLAFLVAAGIAAWHSSRLPAKASPDEDKQHLQNQLRKGIGSEVRFAARPEQADEAVASAADFIGWRSGLKLSEGFKKRLAKAESDVLNGKSPYITVDELTDDMTAGVVERLATLTDKEIEEAADASSDAYGEVSRANAKWGVMKKEDLIRQAKAGRERSRDGDVVPQLKLRPMIEGEVNDRVSTLSALLPEQFGNANSQGVTPTQALLIAYSVATDDPLTNSRSDIAQMLMQKRMDQRQTREQRKAQKNVSGRPYGPKGVLHPSAPNLFFTKSIVDKLLNLNEGGKKQ